MKGRIEVLVAGFGGQGIVLAGYIIGRAASIYEKRESVFVPSYGPEARGGACRSGVVVDDKKIGYPYVSAPNIFVVMFREAYQKYIPMLKEGGILIYDENLVNIDERAGKAKAYKIPATKLAEELGNKIVANVIMLGFLTAVTGMVSYDAMKQSILDRVPKKYADLNIRAFETGYTHGKMAKS